MSIRLPNVYMTYAASRTENATADTMMTDALCLSSLAMISFSNSFLTTRKQATINVIQRLMMSRAPREYSTVPPA